MEPDSSFEIRNFIEIRFLALCLGNALELEREELLDVDILSICCFDSLATLAPPFLFELEILFRSLKSLRFPKFPILSLFEEIIESKDIFM